MSTRHTHAYTASPSSDPFVTLARADSSPGRSSSYGRHAVWFFRALLVIPFALMAPEMISAIMGQPDGIANISASVADVLGTSTFLIFIMMLAVTPLYTTTGWRWHDTFPGSPLTRVGGHTFLVAGTLATLLLVPLVLTANKRAQRWLGRHWKSVQRLTYVVWATVLVHLFLLFGLTTVFLYALAVSAPLAFLRIPFVRRWWDATRRAHSHRALRALAGLALIAVFAVGYVPLMQELAVKGSAAFVQSPVRD